MTILYSSLLWIHSAHFICRLAGEVENIRFRTRSQFMMEDGEISDLFDAGKPPSSKRPPKPLNEINIPKLTTESTVKPKIKTGDRKSTRLNSSHQIISYAVFCLKKKKHHPPPPPPNLFRRH